jgi:hypothetical protein
MAHTYIPHFENPFISCRAFGLFPKLGYGDSAAINMGA